MTMKDLEYKNLVAKAMPGFEQIESHFERSCTEGKMLFDSMARY
jgi:hypothetical protein